MFTGAKKLQKGRYFTNNFMTNTDEEVTLFLYYSGVEDWNHSSIVSVQIPANFWVISDEVGLFVLLLILV